MRLFARLLLAIAITAASASAVLADEGYETVKPGATETQVSAPLFVTIAYGLFWVVLLVYLIGIWRREGRLAAEVAELRRTLGREPRS